MDQQNSQQNNSSNNQPTNTPTPSTDNKLVMGVLSYIGPLVIISYLVARQDPFVRFHIKQGLVLVIIELVVGLASSFFWPFWIFFQIINFCTLILSIIGIINVVNKQEKELPIVGHYAKNINI